tara:strand:- start:695 stop:1984 length:1290 start_codon:yes stop_codon:yes gene_type:complete
MEASLIKKVLDRIDETESELLEFLSDSIKFKSINPDMIDDDISELKDYQEWTQRKLLSWNIFDDVEIKSTDESQPNVIATLKNHKKGSLIFNGHSDVVPVTKDQENAWDLGSPWGGEIVDNKICGRGASDMKGGTIAFLWAIKSIVESKIELKKSVIATLVSGEETGNHKVGIDNIPDLEIRDSFIISGEPTGMKVCSSSVGEFYFLIKIVGKSTSLSNRHLSIYPQKSGSNVPGVNAIDKMWKIQRALYDLERDWGVWQKHDLMEAGNMNINISKIKGGETYSALADSCEIVGSVLFNPDLSLSEVVDQFKKTVESLKINDTWLRKNPPLITIPYILDAKSPINISPKSSYCRVFSEAFENIKNEKPQFNCSTTTSDANYLHQYGHDIITFGPGSIESGVHGPNEYIDIKNLVDCTKIYALAAINWCE